MYEHPSEISIEYCDCKEICSRWGLYDDGSGGWFCPYVPKNVETDTNKCKKLHHLLGKDIQPTFVKKGKVMVKHTDVIYRMARAMQRENRPSSDYRNRDQREEDEDNTLEAYENLARSAWNELNLILPSLKDTLDIGE